MESVAQSTVTGTISRTQRSIAFAIAATALYFMFVSLFIFNPAWFGTFPGDTLSLGVVAHPAMIVGLLVLSYFYLVVTDRADDRMDEGVRT